MKILKLQNSYRWCQNFMGATSVQEGFANLVICKFDSTPTCIRTWKTKFILVHRNKNFKYAKFQKEIVIFYLLKSVLHKYDCTKYYLHIPTSLTINYNFCFENIMNIIFVIESEVVDSPNTLDLLSAFCWSWRLNTSLVKDTSETELEKKICNTVQLTRTMAVGNYACFIKKNIKDLILQNVAFLFCYNDDEKVFFLLTWK